MTAHLSPHFSRSRINIEEFLDAVRTRFHPDTYIDIDFTRDGWYPCHSGTILILKAPVDYYCHFWAGYDPRIHYRKLLEI